MKIDVSNALMNSVVLTLVVGAVGGVLCLNIRVRKFALDCMKSFIPNDYLPKAMKFSVVGSEEDEEVHQVVQISCKNGIRNPEGALVEGKRDMVFRDGREIQLRNVSKNGDCFFLCYAVTLLEFLHENPALVDGFLARAEGLDEGMRDGLSQIVEDSISAQNEEKLEALFADSHKMQKMVSILRKLTALSIEEKPDIEVYESLSSMPDKETIYRSIPDEDLKTDRRLPFEQISKDILEDICNNMWASDSLIYVLCEKMGLGLHVFHPELENSVEFNTPCGNVFVSGRHYQVLYFPKRKEVENVLIALYKEKNAESACALIQSKESLDDLSKEKAIDIVTRAAYAELEKDLKEIFLDEEAMSLLATIFTEPKKSIHLSRSLIESKESLEEPSKEADLKELAPTCTSPKKPTPRPDPLIKKQREEMREGERFGIRDIIKNEDSKIIGYVVSVLSSLSKEDMGTIVSLIDSEKCVNNASKSRAITFIKQVSKPDPELYLDAVFSDNKEVKILVEIFKKLLEVTSLDKNEEDLQNLEKFKSLCETKCQLLEKEDCYSVSYRLPLKEESQEDEERRLAPSPERFNRIITKEIPNVPTEIQEVLEELKTDVPSEVVNDA